MASTTDLSPALLLLSDPQPHTRQQALDLLAAYAAAASTSTSTSTSDAVFQRLCVVAATDTVDRLRLQALQALAVLHHASTAIKLQALSKKATLRVLQQQTPASAQQPPPAKKQKQQHKQQQPAGQQQQQEQANAGLLDAATGALVHGTEDDMPRVRLAAVAAIVSLGRQDAIFAEAAGALLSDLVGDQLLEVRLTALQALLAQAAAFQQQRKQQQQQQGQGQGQAQPLTGDCDARQDDADADADGEEAGIEEEEADALPPDTQESGDSVTAAAAAAAGSPAQPDQGPLSASPTTTNQQQQQQQVRRHKPRKSDLPPWGKDALLAGVAALSDGQPGVRGLALQLLQLLPPANVPDLLAVVTSLAACCERYGGACAAAPCHADLVWALVEHLGTVRAEMISLAPAKLVPMLAGLVAAATAANSETAVGAAAVLPDGAQVLTRLLLAGVQRRRQGLQPLLRELQKAQLLEVPALQPWLASVRALQE